MNNYFSLTKVLLKTGLNMGSMNMNRKKNGKLKKPMSSTASWIISIVVLIPVALVMGAGGMGLYQAFSASGQVAAGYELLANMGALMVLVFSIPYVLSVFFMSSDLEALLPLPLKPSQITGAKFTSVVIYEYLIIAMFYAPMLIGFGIAAEGGVMFWITAIISILVVPITPVVYASFFAIILMRLLKNVKNKEMITTIGTFIMMFAIMAFSMSIGAFTGGSAASPGEDMTAAMAGIAGKADMFARLGVIFPNSKLLANAFADNSVIMLLLYLLTVAAFLGVFLLFSEKLYFKGVKGVRETSSRSGKKFTAEDLKEGVRQGSPKKAFLRKELKTLIRSPEYFTNCLMMPILFPLIMMVSMCVPLFTSLKNELGDGDFKEIIAALTSEVSPTMVLPIVLLIVFVLAIFISGSNFTTGTCLSREGKGFIYMKAIPMPYRDQLEAKAWCGLLVSFLASLPYVLLISIASIFLFGLYLDVVLLALVIDVLTLMFCNYIQLWFDLMSPKLNWENEQGAVRQNYNTAIAMLVVFFIGGILGAAAFALTKALPLPIGGVIAISIGVLLLLSLVLRGAVLAYGERKLNRLEG